MDFYKNRLRWPVDRTVRSLRVYVVEPYSYSPEEHAVLFYAAIENLVNPRAQEIDAAHGESMALAAETFDLVTFPEAFLPSSDLITALMAISSLPSCGCVHVGLRPSCDASQHLFKVSELKVLVQQLQDIPNLEKEDLVPFSDWLGIQHSGKLFNIGCLFSIDATGKLRVCLHPKIVKSKFEIGMLHEMSMSEADMLTLVTLVPTNKRFRSVTIQPLLCSDVLNLETDRPDARPLYAVNTDDGKCFGEDCPEHVDIVSLATCTPQPEYRSETGFYYQWQPEFQDAFRRAAADDALSKHHHALFVLSNFRTISDGKLGGLSGAFIPVPLAENHAPPYLTISVWGYPKSYRSPTRWSHSADTILGASGWASSGYIASLQNTNSEVVARMVGFTINKLPREASLWRPHNGLTDFKLFLASRENLGGSVIFKEQVA